MILLINWINFEGEGNRTFKYFDQCLFYLVERNVHFQELLVFIYEYSRLVLLEIKNMLMLCKQEQRGGRENRMLLIHPRANLKCIKALGDVSRFSQGWIYDTINSLLSCLCFPKLFTWTEAWIHPHDRESYFWLQSGNITSSCWLGRNQRNYQTSLQSTN